jgi:hypothetical protein
MVRTQIQLTEVQYQALKDEAHQQNVSLSEAVRAAVDLWLARLERSRRARRSIASLGRFRSGRSDIAERHDAHLTEIYRGSAGD